MLAPRQNSNLRILEICTSDSLGGLELYFVSCCKNLTQRRHSLLALVHEKSRIASELKGLVDTIEVSGNLFDRIILTKKVISQFQPDIIHVHHKKDLFLGAVMRRFSKSFGLIHTRQMNFPRRKKNPYHTFVYRSYDLIIAITDRLKKEMVVNLYVNPTKITRLYYGVPVAQNKSRHQELQLGDGFNIGVIARIDSKKDQLVIIDAIVKLNDPSIRIHLIGGTTDDQYRKKLEATLSDLNLSNQVIMYGHVESPQELMHFFDLIVLTTSEETFGLVLPEAMRNEVAVIGANGGGVPEIIDHELSGLLFEPGNSDDLASSILRMMNDEFRNMLAKRGKQVADERFELTKHFDHLESLMLGEFQRKT